MQMDPFEMLDIGTISRQNEPKKKVFVIFKRVKNADSRHSEGGGAT